MVRRAFDVISTGGTNRFRLIAYHLGFVAKVTWGTVIAGYGVIMSLSAGINVHIRSGFSETSLADCDVGMHAHEM